MSFKKFLFASFISAIIFSCSFANNKGYKIDVRVHGLQDTTAFLAYHYGNRQYISDTVRIDNQGKFLFSGDTLLDKGIYMIVLPGQTYFEILVDYNQHFGIETQKDDLVNSISFTNSPDNEAFYEYMKFIKAQGEATTPLRSQLQDPNTSETQKEQIRQELSVVDDKVKQEQNRIISQFREGLLGKILLTQQEPPMPDPKLNPDGTTDQLFMYQAYKNSFWQNIDLTDDRLVRTPLLHGKLNQFFTRVVIQIPDSIIAEADAVIAKAKANEEVFKYVIFFITNTFERSQIMGMDAVFVHMVENYYMNGQTPWVNKEQLTSINERAMALKPLLLGKVAPDITVFTRDRQPLRLHQVNAAYTVLYFWDSECSHCKKNTPKLKEFYTKMKSKQVEIFAVNTEPDRESWLKYVDSNALTWINVNDPNNTSQFRDKYDIWATPLILLLDKDKKIIAKKISVEQLEDIIMMEMEKNSAQ